MNGMTWFLILIVIGIAMAFLWYKQPLPKPHGDWTVPPQPKPFMPLEDEFLKNQPPLATLVDDKLIETLPPPLSKGKLKAPRSHHKKGK